MNTAALATRLTGARIGAQPILHAIDLHLAPGRWVAVVGPNGAGKSTLLRVLAGLLPGDGQVWLQGRPLADWPARARAAQLAWLGQAEGGADDLLTEDVAMLGRLPHRPWLAPPDAADHAAVEQALHATQAGELRGRRLGELSGGERQRVLLARANPWRTSTHRTRPTGSPLPAPTPPPAAWWSACCTSWAWPCRPMNWSSCAPATSPTMAPAPAPSPTRPSAPPLTTA